MRARYSDITPKVVWCSNCQSRNEPGDHVCRNCGAKLCPKCHSVVPPGSRYCTHCMTYYGPEPPVKAGAAPSRHMPSTPPVSHATETKAHYACPQCGSVVRDASATECHVCGYIGRMQPADLPHHLASAAPPIEAAGIELMPVRPSPPPPRPQEAIPARMTRAPEEVKTCPHCYEKIPDPYSRICPHCGKRCGSGKQVDMVTATTRWTEANQTAKAAAMSAAMPASPMLKELRGPIRRERGGGRPSRSEFVEELMGGGRREKRERLPAPPGARRFPLGLMLVVILLVVVTPLLVFAFSQDIFNLGSKPATPPTQPPTSGSKLEIKNLSIGSVTQSGAVITWKTEKPATSKVEYCSPAGMCSWKDSASMVKDHSITLSGLSPATKYHLTILSKDQDGTEAKQEQDMTTAGQADSTPPAISGVNHSNITESSATITWATDEPATTQVKYGITEACESSTPRIDTMSASHSVTMSGLSAGTKYYYKVISRDASGNEATSAQAQAFTTTTPPPTGSAVGNLAPDFSLQDINGNTVTLSQFRGKKVMVNFWATWCGPCKNELPHFQTLSSRTDLVILAIAVPWQGEDLAAVRSFMNSNGYTFRALFDSNRTALTQYNIGNSIPWTYFIDAQGIIRKIQQGAFVSQSEIEAILNTF